MLLYNLANVFWRQIFSDELYRENRAQSITFMSLFYFIVTKQLHSQKCCQ